MLENVYRGLNVKNVYEGLNACSEVYSSKEYFCKMYPTFVSSKLRELIVPTKDFVIFLFLYNFRRSFGARISDVFGPTKEFVIFLFLDTFPRLWGARISDVFNPTTDFVIFLFLEFSESRLGTDI